MTPEEIQAQRDAVVVEATSWLRTRYHHQGDIKGVGVDCAMLLVRVFGAAGVIPNDLDPRPYPADWHLHRTDERYLGWVSQYGAIVQTPAPGDVAVYRFGRCYSHGAIVVAENTVIHSYLKRGVELASMLHDPLADRPVTYYTLWPEA
jgi:cell wall-associated NlpC family hydrolase